MCVPLQPGRMPTTLEGNILDVRDITSQQITGCRSRMRIIVTVKHEHWYVNGGERSRLYTLLLKPKDVLPGLIVTDTVDLETLVITI